MIDRAVIERKARHAIDVALSRTSRPRPVKVIVRVSWREPRPDHHFTMAKVRRRSSWSAWSSTVVEKRVLSPKFAGEAPPFAAWHDAEAVAAVVSEVADPESLEIAGACTDVDWAVGSELEIRVELDLVS